MPRFRRLPISLVAAWAISSLSACQDQAGRLTGAPAAPPDISRYVTGAAAAALDENGLFPAVEPAPRERPIISREEAARQALAYVKSYAQFMIRSWEEERGGPIRTGSLRASPRVYYAESPYGAFPEGPYHPAFRRIFGPYYVVTLQDGPEPVLMVAVSAFNTEVWVDERGDVRQPSLGGGEFMSAAVPQSAQAYRFPSPERAVERVALAAGARVNGVPELVLRGRYHPSLALWKVPLERGTRVRGKESNASRVVDALYVDGRGRYFIPRDQRPDALVLDLPVGPPWEPEVRRTMSARIPVVAPTDYDEVAVEAGS